MAVSTVVKTRRDGTLTIKDGAGSPLELVVAYEQGDLSFSIPGPTVSVFLDRGRFGTTPSLRYGDDQAVTGTFTAYLRHPSDATDEVLSDLLCQTGKIASWASTLGTNAEVRAFTLEFFIEGTDHGDSADYTYTFSHCAFSGSISEGDPSTISVSFTSHALYPGLS